MAVTVPNASALFTSDSRYRLTTLHLDSKIAVGRLRLGSWKVPQIDMTEYDWYLVKTEDIDRLDLVSYRAYGTSKYWWAIAYVNHIANPFEDLELGTNLRIPKLGAVVAALSGV